MARSDTLSVRISPETRQMLDWAANAQNVAGAAALARDILEKWAAIERDNGWADDPAEFFRVL